MKIFTNITVIILLLFAQNIKAQNVAPLELGNIWVYDLNSNLSRTTVVDTSVYFDSAAYYKMFYEDNYGTINFYTYSRLKDDGFYVLFDEFDSTETPYYKKNAVIGDTWTIYPYVYTIEDTFVANVFGEQTTVKFLAIDSGLLLIYEYWTEKFGKLSSSQFPNPWLMENLLGCVIDGVAYGDTSFIIISVEDDREIPNNFYLAQNYPNPFNPTTKIRFRIAELGFVSLKIYDVLGNELATLINKEMPTGEYEVEFNAENLSSGIHFYSLRAGDKLITKKMVLLR